MWSKKYGVIISEHNTKRDAKTELRQLKRDIKAGIYDE